MAVIFGIDGQILRGLIAALPALGGGRPPAVVDWQSIRAGDAVSSRLNERFWSSPDVSSTDAVVMRSDHVGVPVRIYRRRDSTARALIVYVHGGGMVAGNLDVYNSRCAAYTQATGIPLVSVGYGLAPEHPYPRALDDVLTVIHDVHEHAEGWGVDRHRIGIAGDSAGGGIAAAVTLRLRDERRAHADGPRIASALLVYPMLDNLTLSPAGDDPNMRSRWVSWTYAQNAVGWEALLGSLARSSNAPAYAAPARADDLADLPSTFIDVGTLDIFRAEDEGYAKRLRASGVDVEFRLIDAVPHGFDVVAPKADLTRRAWDARFAFLTRTLLWT